MKNYSNTAQFDLFNTSINTEQIRYGYVIPSLLASFYGLIFILGISFNFIIILIYSQKQSLKNFTKFFFINLSVSDMLILAICIPRTICDLYTDGEWKLGYLYCKYLFYIRLSKLEK